MLKKINMYDLEHNFIRYFWGATQAMEYILENKLSTDKTTMYGKRHIINCCEGNEPNAYNFIWEYDKYK